MNDIEGFVCPSHIHPVIELTSQETKDLIQSALDASQRKFNERQQRLNSIFT